MPASTPTAPFLHATFAGGMQDVFRRPLHEQSHGESFLDIAVTLDRDGIEARSYPLSIPAIRALSTLELHPQVTLLTGENGSGRSTLVEAIAVEPTRSFLADRGRFLHYLFA